MSTWIYLECRTHDPVLRDSDEVGQHLSDLPDVQHWLTNRERILGAFQVLTEFDPFDHDSTNRYWANTVRFMRQHPKCEIGIRDEYGREHPTENEEA